MKHAMTNATQWMFRRDRDAFSMLTPPTLVEEEICKTDPDDVTVEVSTTGAYDVFDAPSEESIEKVNSARSILNGQASGLTFSEAVKYLSFKNIWRPWLLDTSPTLVLKVLQVCGPKPNLCKIMVLFLIAGWVLYSLQIAFAEETN